MSYLWEGISNLYDTETTISDHIHGKYGGSTKVGKPPVFTENVERELVTKVKKASYGGLGLTG